MMNVHVTFFIFYLFIFFFLLFSIIFGFEQHGPEVIKLFSCSTQMSMKFSPLIYVKMPTIVGILTCMSGKNSILGLSEPKKC